MLDDALLSAPNWTPQLLDIKGSQEEVAGLKIALADIQTLQETVENPFITNLK